MKAEQDAHKAELSRLKDILERYKPIKKQVAEARREGVRCVSRTDSEGMEKYWLIDECGRVLSGEYGTWQEAWLSFLE